MKKLLSILLAIIATAVFGTASYAQANHTKSGGEEFYIISSVNQARSQVLLKHPTEVTVLMQIGDKAQIVDDQGKTIRLSDLRAGDTVWVVASNSADHPVASRIRKGQITVAELHQLYLDYPVLK